MSLTIPKGWVNDINYYVKILGLIILFLLKTIPKQSIPKKLINIKKDIMSENNEVKKDDEVKKRIKK